MFEGALEERLGMLDVNCAHKNILSIEVTCYDRLKYADDSSEHKKNKAHKSVTAKQQFSAKDSKLSHYSTCKVRPQSKGIQN